jgi:hypothetical protein
MYARPNIAVPSASEPGAVATAERDHAGDDHEVEQRAQQQA